MRKNDMRKEKGITLIALVITIIVLLILAGVTIAMLTGDNGILTKTNQAKTNTSKGEAADKINMALNAEYANILSDGKMSGASDSAIATADEIADWVYFIAVVNKSMTGQDVIIDNGELTKFNFVW